MKWSFVLSWIDIFDKIGTLCVFVGGAIRGGGCMIMEASEKGWILAIVGFSYKIASKIASLLAFHLSRIQEYAADRFSAELTAPDVVASALQKIEALNDELIA